MISFLAIDALADIHLAAWKRSIRPDAEPDDHDRAEETRNRRDYALALRRVQAAGLIGPERAEALLSQRPAPARLVRMSDVHPRTRLVGVAIALSPEGPPTSTEWRDRPSERAPARLLQALGAHLLPLGACGAPYRFLVRSSSPGAMTLVDAVPQDVTPALRPSIVGLVDPDSLKTP